MQERIIQIAGASGTYEGLADSSQVFDFGLVLSNFCKWYEQSLSSQGVFLSPRISHELPRHFHGNPLLIGDLFYDLASYSLPHISEGCVVLDVEAEPLSEDRYTIYCTITTSGLGIPSFNEKKLFLPFSAHADTRESTDYPASLYHAQTVARMYDGDVVVQNSVGFGTRYMAEISLTRSV